MAEGNRHPFAYQSVSPITHTHTHYPCPLPIPIIHTHYQAYTHGPNLIEVCLVCLYLIHRLGN